MNGWSFDANVLRGAIGGEVLIPGEPWYDVARKPALARFHDSRPRADVLATTAADVAETIRFARRFGMRATPRSGGHCFAGRSSTGDIIIDVTPMRAVSVSDGVATVGAGARLGDLYDALGHGRTIPAGCGLTVGIAGLTLGGGLGVLGPKYGLTCDHLRSARVELADGRVVDCDEAHDEELFWALQGAGGGHLGVVTSLVFSTVPAPTSTYFHLVWPSVFATVVVDAWQTWAPTAPDDLDASLRVTVSGDDVRSPVVNLFGAMHGTETDTAALLGELVARVSAKPASEFRRQMPYREVKRHLSGLGSVDSDADQPRRDIMSSKSEFFRRRLPPDAITTLFDNLAEGCRPGQSRELNFTPWAGAYNRVPGDATAFVHRDELFMVEHVEMVDPNAPGAERRAASEWLIRSWASLHPWGSGRVYPNFPDPGPRGLG
jgi:FAD binding domain